MIGHPQEALSAYADGELSPDEAREIERHLDGCTECARELSLIRSIGGAMRTIRAGSGRSTWEGVHRRITSPIGWALVVTGGAVWVALALASWLRQELTLEWLAASAVGVGLAMVAVGIGYEQYREWKDSPYKDIER